MHASYPFLRPLCQPLLSQGLLAFARERAGAGGGGGGDPALSGGGPGSGVAVALRPVSVLFHPPRNPTGMVRSAMQHGSVSLGCCPGLQNLKWCVRAYPGVQVLAAGPSSSKPRPTANAMEVGWADGRPVRRQAAAAEQPPPPPPPGVPLTVGAAGWCCDPPPRNPTHMAQPRPVPPRPHNLIGGCRQSHSGGADCCRGIFVGRGRQQPLVLESL